MGMEERVFVGVLFVVLGGIQAIAPEKYFEFQKMIGKKIMGISYKASPKTFRIYKMLGVFFVIVGLIVLVWG